MKGKYQTIIKIFRIFLVLIFTISILIIGSRFSILVQKGNADIFNIFSGPERNLPDFREGSNQSPIGKSVVNGVPFAYSVEVTDASIEEVVEFYKDTLTPDFYRIFPNEFLEKAGVKEGDKTHKVISGLERIISKKINPVFSFKNETYGFVAGLDRGDNSKWFVEKTENTKDKLVGKAVIAVKTSQDSPKTNIIRYWTEGKLDLNKLIPDMANDVEGFDLSDVDRHPYSVRVMCMNQEDRFSKNNIVSYYIEEKVHAVLIYYLSNLRSNNWEISKSAMEGGFNANKSNFIYAKKNERILNVFLTEQKDFGGTFATFVEK